MKKSTKRNLKLSKVAIASINDLIKKHLKGGTDTISEDINTNFPPGYQMTDMPDENGICYNIR